jgi:hypothetical protein
MGLDVMTRRGLHVRPERARTVAFVLGAVLVAAVGAWCVKRVTS